MSEDIPRPARRKRYGGKNPRRFEDKYKEHNPGRFPETFARVVASGKTPAGAHVPVMVEECIDALRLAPGMTGVDGTLGYGGHAAEFLKRLAPGGRLIGLDRDAAVLPQTEARLRALGHAGDSLVIRKSNFAGIGKVLGELGLVGVDFVFADFGCSSMQLDDPKRGFSFKHDGPLDMRMNPESGLSAADLLRRSRADDLAAILVENADEPRAELLAMQLAGCEFETTLELARAVRACVPDDIEDKTVRRVFQAIRIAVNDEFGAIDALFRSVPYLLNPGARLAVLTFHSGEDRRAKIAMKQGVASGLYAGCGDVIVASPEERRGNPRSIPAKLRWAVRAV
jgi:16S rRNA (cytosine1402-N4)-methyltransferase